MDSGSLRLVAGLVCLLALAGAAPAPASETVLTDVQGGLIVDATPDRVVWRPDDATWSLELRTIATQLDQPVPMPAGRVPTGDAHLFGDGVLFATLPSSGAYDPQLHEWRPGDPLADLGAGEPASLVVEGNYAIWNHGSPPAPNLTRRDLAAQTSTLVGSNAGNLNNDVAANGDVVYWTQDYKVKRWRNGVTTQLSVDGAARPWATYPVTDGANTLYRRTMHQCCAPGGSTVFHDGITESALPASAVSSFPPDPGRDYAVRAGWIAWTDQDRRGVSSRSPTGTVASVTAGGAPGSTAMFGLAPTGQVMYARGLEAFLGSPGARPFPLGSAARGFWEAGRWYLVRRSTLARVDTDTAIVQRPADLTRETTAQLAAASTAVDAEFTCTLDGAPAVCPEATLSELADGPHTFTARSRDPALAEDDPTPATATWTVDTAPPAPFAVTTPAHGQAVNQTHFTWEQTVDPGGRAIHSYEVTIDGEVVWTQPASHARDLSFGSIPATDGPHTWSVRATDAAGNTRDTPTASFTLDTAPPSSPPLTGPADGAALSGARPTLSWEGAADGGSGIAGYDVAIDGAVTRVGAGATSFTPGADLADGVHTWTVTAVDSAGNATQAGPRTFRVDTRPPEARLAADPNPALANQTITFSASESQPAAAELVRFEWDLDGDGSYDSETGATPTAERAYADPQDVRVAVRVTDAAGRSGEASLPVSVTPAPLPGPAGVSIDAGERFTNEPNVMLTLRWPLFATAMLVSNDGGFGGAAPLPLAPFHPWRLDSGGSERLPKTVYVRFLGGLAGNETYQDDIILDETAPRVVEASVEQVAAAARSRSAARSLYVVRNRVAERNSGPAALRLAVKRSQPWKKRRYARTLRTAARRAPRWIRVFDRAGNRSRWRRLEPRP